MGEESQRRAGQVDAQAEDAAAGAAHGGVEINLPDYRALALASGQQVFAAVGNKWRLGKCLARRL
jgi:hypothetical protein